jgi:hypothetical protein
MRSHFCLASAAAVGLLVAGVPVLAAGPPSGLDVRVVNTPLPVQGTVAISNLPAPPAQQLVTLHADFSAEGNCPSFGGKVANFNVAFNADGSTAPFTVPAGSSLVITAVEILGFSGVPNGPVQTRLFRVGAGVQEFSIRESIADGTGRIFHRYEFPSGVEIASSTRVCSNANDFNLVMTGYLYGYVKSAP